MIERKILSLVVSDQCEESYPAVILGLAYCTKKSGNSRYKPTSAQRALTRLSSEACFGLPWQKLTQLLISATTCEIISTNDEIALPQASNQPNIGDTCDSQILVNTGRVIDMIDQQKPMCILFKLHQQKK